MKYSFAVIATEKNDQLLSVWLDYIIHSYLGEMDLMSSLWGFSLRFQYCLTIWKWEVLQGKIISLRVLSARLLLMVYTLHFESRLHKINLHFKSFCYTDWYSNRLYILSVLKSVNSAKTRLGRVVSFML